jgi:Flp pilus assembly protein TadD
MEIAAAFMDQKRSTEARKNAIGSYERLMLLQKNPDSRGLNLELAGLLVMDGQFSRALAIYEKFTKKFPKEFTFHLGAAKAHLEMNDLKSARTEAEQAVRFAYGDNLIRSMDRLLKIMQKQGESAFALRRGEDFLKTIHVDPALKVRTGRYVSALNSTLSELRKEKSKP